MRRFTWLMGLAVALTSSAGYAGLKEDSRFGALHLTAPIGRARGFVVLFSDSNGWNTRTEAVAQGLARQGAFVAGVDLPQYRARFDQRSESCHSLAGDPENLSLETQRALGYQQYHTPILAGIGEGGTIAAVILSEALPATLAGAIALDPTASIRTKRPLCTPASTTPAPDGGFTYGVPRSLNGFWVVGFTSGSAADRGGEAARLRSVGAPVRIEAVPQGKVPAEQLVALIGPHLGAQGQAASVAGLPLVEVRAAHPSSLLAIIISGDGGWRDLDKSIAEFLSRQDVSTVGWDSLRYFWSYKTPQQTARDLASVIETYTAKWRTRAVALIGYSFGADILPFAYNGLSAADKAEVAQISLLGLSETADFEIQVTGWLGARASNRALPVEPALAGVAPSLIQCFYGEAETDSVCPTLIGRGAEVIRTRGSHHFGGDYNALARRILEGLHGRVRGVQ